MTVLASILAFPGIRVFVEDLVIRLIFSGALFHSDADPVYREKSLALMGQLQGATTEDAKRAILVQIQSLRKPSAT